MALVRVIAQAEGYHNGTFYQPGDIFTADESLLDDTEKHEMHNGVRVKVSGHKPATWFKREKEAAKDEPKKKDGKDLV